MIFLKTTIKEFYVILILYLSITFLLIGVYIINIDVAIILFSITTIIFIYVSYKQYKELYLEKKYKKIMLHICNEAKNKLKFFNSKSSNNTAYAVVTTSIHIYYLFLMYNCVNKKFMLHIMTVS
jgi:uncharacterized membrane protein